MSAHWLVGIDDTDNPDSIGTGRLARMLAAHLEEAGLLSGSSVTRHQFLVHPDIPYTSHNSSACIAGHGPDAAEPALLDAASTFLRTHYQEGSNPGLCVATPERVSDALVTLAGRAQKEVLTLEAFDRSLAGEPLAIRWWGETGQGRIGATSGVALRSRGDDGRFIALAGIRDLRGTLCVAEILERSAVAAVEDENGEALPPDARIDTGDWVRPALRSGRPTLRVRPQGGLWVPAEKRSKEA